MWLKCLCLAMQANDSKCWCAIWLLGYTLTHHLNLEPPSMRENNLRWTINYTVFPALDSLGKKTCSQLRNWGSCTLYFVLNTCKHNLLECTIQFSCTLAHQWSNSWFSHHVILQRKKIIISTHVNHSTCSCCLASLRFINFQAQFLPLRCQSRKLCCSSLISSLRWRQITHVSANWYTWMRLCEYSSKEIDELCSKLLASQNIEIEVDAAVEVLRPDSNGNPQAEDCLPFCGNNITKGDALKGNHDVEGCLQDDESNAYGNQHKSKRPWCVFTSLPSIFLPFS